MLTENDVVEILAEHLSNQGYQIIQSLTTNEKGVDLIAEKNGVRLYVEAKGETSSKATTNRYGKPFNKNQIKSHVSRAILTSMKVQSSKPNSEVAIALPDTDDHKQLIQVITPSLKKLGIGVYWVSKSGVRMD
ncbi:restriction endonuclease [Ekhidna sp. MALMAid0563]